MRALRAAILCAAALAVPAPAAAQVHLSLFHPVSTNADPSASANFAFSVFQSRTGSLTGLGIHPIVSSVDGPATGFLLGGAYSRVDGPVAGAQVTLGIAADRDQAGGLLVAGIGQFVEGRARGLQFAGVVNSVRADFRGFQFAGFANMTAGRARGVQMSSVANIAEGGLRGLQVAGGLNFAQDEVRGLQLGLGNLASADVHGAQLGVYNIAGAAHGLQLGAVNLSNTNDGVPLGLLNLSNEDGTIDVTAFASTLSAANVGVRTTVNRFQSVLAVGGPDLEGDVSESAFLSWMIGYRIPLSEKVDVGVDVGFSHIMPKKSDDPAENDRLHFALLARVLPELRVSETVAIFAGPGIASIHDEYQSGAETTEFLGTAGLAVRVK